MRYLKIINLEIIKLPIAELARDFEGELFEDQTTRILYATDASAYRELPQAVAIPRSVKDLKKLIAFAQLHRTSLIARTAGTSLAGQVVGSGIIVDLSKYFNRILEFNKDEKWVRVEPGVIRDELNMFLKPSGLFFGPETSTANRAMIGGMVGNNSCGSNSVVYRSTREHLVSVKALLSDGSEVEFGSVSVPEFRSKTKGQSLEAQLYQSVESLLSDPINQQEILEHFPKKSVERRNTGYAIDLLLNSAPFQPGAPDFNFCKLIAGSEGTLAILTEIKLNLVDLPPRESCLLCVHFNSIDESLRANLIALQFKPTASELIDHYILECTKDNIEQRKNRFFVQGDPAAILVVEFSGHTREEVTTLAQHAESALRASGLGCHFPVLFGEDTAKVWSLRKAGLGLLGNMPGDSKAVPVIEDTAVDVLDLPDYIRDFNAILAKHNLYSVHYAHAGSGEIHLRPILNLKTEQGNQMFRTIGEEIAALVKRYGGSLSGEHGDGRLRGEFIRRMVGERNYQLLRQVKNTWDPNHVFNPGKIVDAPPMDTMLRYTPGQETPRFQTIFRFHKQDILQHAEQCNGSGDCRKTQLSGGTMCPSYMATRNEKDTTRARANILREFLTHSSKMNRFDHQEIYDVMDLCLSCKGCKSECPSNVDVTKLKAEFLQHYYEAHRVPFRTLLIAQFSAISRLGALAPRLYNLTMTNGLMSRFVKRTAGFAPKRSLPTLHTTTLRRWFQNRSKTGVDSARPLVQKGGELKGKRKKVLFFCDEFTNFSDTIIGIKAIELLEHLGYEVKMPVHLESGRTWLSKGLVRKAKSIAEQNICLLSEVVTDETALIGVEPSAILTLRDEYLDLCSEELSDKARKIASQAFTIEEFLSGEWDSGQIDQELFTKQKRQIKFHGHCQQKALSSVRFATKVLSIPENYSVELIPSGCCGMAGSFGYEKEHFDLSMKIGELVLFPAVRNSVPEVLIAASGTSCRHQIKDGTGRSAYHTVEILFDALVR